MTQSSRICRSRLICKGMSLTDRSPLSSSMRHVVALRNLLCSQGRCKAGTHGRMHASQALGRTVMERVSSRIGPRWDRSAPGLAASSSGSKVRSRCCSMTMWRAPARSASRRSAGVFTLVTVAESSAAVSCSLRRAWWRCGAAAAATSAPCTLERVRGWGVETLMDIDGSACACIHSLTKVPASVRLGLRSRSSTLYVHAPNSASTQLLVRVCAQRAGIGSPRLILR